MQLNEFIHQNKHLDLFTKKVVEGFLTGLHKSPFHGFSVEFAEHRQYNQGEDIKHIDWKLLSRTDKLFIKKYEDETNLRCHIIIDQSSSMFFPQKEVSKYQYSIIAAACLLQIIKKQKDAFSVSFFSDKIDLSTATKSTGSHFIECINLLQNKLNKTADNIKTNTGEVLHHIAEKINKRGLVVIFTDLNEYANNQAALLKGLQHLYFKKHDIIIFNAIDSSLELALNFDDVPTKFIDSETSEFIKLNPKDVRASYRESVAAYRNTILEKCRQYKIDIFEADINKDLENIIATFIRKRSKYK